MKRLITLLSLLLVWASSTLGQTTITIGTGTSTGRYPLNDFYIYSRSQCLYLASEIGMSGVVNKLRWYRDDTGADPNAIGLTEIWLMETPNSVLTGTTWEGPGTLVASISNIDLGSGGSWFEIDISDFNYSGSQNLLVSVYTQNAPYVTPHSTWRYTSSSPNYLSRLGNSDSSNPPTLTLSYSRPNIQLEIVDLTDMVFSSATTLTASTSPVLAGSTNQPILALQVVTTGSQNPISVTAVDFTTSGTTSTSDLTGAKVFYTTTNTFSTSTPFGNTITNPNGTISFSGTRTLVSGNNYFWLCYDISGTATEWNVADGTCTQFTTSEPQTRTPTATDPAGSRTIRLPLAGTYTINNTLPTGGTNYISFTDACNDLNNLGHSAAVTFNVLSDQTFTKTVPASPYNYAYLIMNYIGSVSSPVVFQKSGSGANPVLSITGSSATTDIGIFLYGCDYVTFNGINIMDAGTTSSDYLDRGYLLQGPTDNNCNHVTIQNSTIDLNKNNVDSKCIYAFPNAPTSAANTNRDNTFSGNTLQDTYNGIYLAGVSATYPDENNVITGNTIQTVGNALSTAVYALYFSYQKNFSVSGNIINIVSGTGSINGIYFSSCDGANNLVTNNTVSNMVGTSTSSVMYGIYHSPVSTATTTFSGNTIYALDHKYNVHGLYIGAGTQNNIFKNKIYNIAYTGTSSYIAYGLNSFAGTTNNIYNNYIYDIKAPASTTTPGTRALNFSGGTTANVYFNTVYLDYTSTVASNQSAALYVTTSPTTLNMSDNIFVNLCNMTVGTRAVAFYKSTTALTNIAATNNNNLYYCGTPSSKKLIWYDGTNKDSTLAQYKARVAPRDANAMWENPPFINPSSPYNLHLQTTVATQCESGGITISTPISVTDDYDADARYPNSGYPNDPSYPATAPDIGADEFAGRPLDINSPNISYTPLVNTTSTSNRPFTSVAITDPSGVNTTAGTRPRVYYKKKSNTNTLGATNDNTTDGWKWVEANGAGNTPFDFTLDYSKLFGPVVALDTTIWYFVVGQDLVTPPNVGINSGVFAAQPASVALTAAAFPITGTINNYKIVGAISGNVTVGTSGTYPTLTGPGGLFADINGKVLTGNIVATIISDLAETGANALNQFTEEPAGSNFTLTIQPDGTTNRTASGTYAGGLIRLNGADRVTFDGRYSGGGKYLTFTNTATSGTIATIQLISLGNNLGASYNTIRNCNISTGINTVTTVYGIAVGGATVATTGSDNDYLTVQDNIVSKAYYGIYIGGTSTGADNNLLIQGNTVGSSTTGNEIKFCALYLTYVDNSMVRLNDIFGITQTASFDAVVATTGVTNTSFSRNKVYNMINNGTNRASAFAVSSGTGSNLTYDNNLIYGIINNGTGGNTFGCYGFYITAGGGYNLYYNSIYMSGDRDAVATTKPTAISAAIFISGGATLNLRNNILENTQTATTNTPKSYAIYSGVANTAYTAINYNDYYVAGTQGMLGYLTADQATLAAWQAATLQDANSISADPLFGSTTDLIPGLGSPVLAVGTPISGVDYDYMNADRDDTNPSMGAYENSGDFAGPAITYTLLGNTTSTSNRPFTNVGITDLSGVNTTAGTNPRVYYKRSTDGNIWNDNTSATDGWKYKEANGGSNPFDFTIDYTKLNGGTGVVQGDVVQYFVVAQDLQTVPNVGINSGTFIAQPASVDLTTAAFPITGTINSYQVSVSYSGTINVGPAETFTSLTADAADGLFKALNNGVLTGNLTVNIMADLTETGAIALNQLSEEPAGSNFTVTIQPDASTSAPMATLKTISGSYAGGLIRLNGADRVTIDGRSGGSGNYLAFINTATTGTIATFQLISLGNNAGATYNTVRNCNISSGFNTSGAYDIVAGGATVASTGADNDNNTIRNNNFSKAYVGIWAQGTAATNPGAMDNLQILENSIGSDTDTEYIGHDGIFVGNGTGCSIAQNTIYNIIPGTSITTPVGMTLSSGFISSSVSRNRIYNIIYTGTGGYGGRGIYVNTNNATSNLTIDNNLIYVIGGDGFSSFGNSSPVGMYFDGTMGGLNIYYNSVYMSGNTSYTSTSAILTTAILFNSSTITAIDLRDNIFMNSMDHLANTNDKNYAIYSSAPAASFTNINYNDYYANGPQGVLGYIAAADKTTLEAWKAATLQDLNSISADPLFASTTDLTVPSGSPVVGAGTPITEIDYDYADTDRSNTIPTIGAYEGVLPLCPMPSVLNADNITPHSANLTWTINGTETAWEYVYGLSPLPVPVVAGTATISSTINPVSGLSESSTYQFYVRAFCDPEFSDWAGPYTFVTPNSCTPPSGLSTGIITTTSAEINWIPGGDESSWNVQVGLPGFTPGTGTEVAGVNGTQSHPWTASPLANSTQYQAYVQANCGFDQPKKENFWFEIDEIPEMIFSKSGGGPVDEDGEDGIWQLYDQAPGDQDWYNVWFYDDPYDPARMKIIRMGFWVKRLNPDAPADISYVVNWSTPGWNPTEPAFPLPMQEEYIVRSPINGPVEVLNDPESINGQWMELYYAISDYNPAWVSVDVWGQNVTVVYEEIAPPDTSALFNWWNLDPQRGGILLHECLPKPMGDASLWSGPLVFQTLCGPNLLPVSQNFDAVTAPALPYCWDKLVSTTSTGGVATYTTYYHTGPNSVRMNTDNDASATLLLISPEISATFPMAGNQVIFWGRGGSAGNQVIVGVMSDPDDAATFTPVSTITLTATFAEYLLELGDYTGSGHYLAFKHGSASTYTSIYIDDVIIEKIPTCHKPTSLVTTNVTQTSADLSWTAGEEGELVWEVKYGPVGFNPVTQGTKVTGIGLPLPYTLSPPLAPNTPYQWYVRGICGVGDTSLWAGPGAFTTLVSPSMAYTLLPNTLTTGNVTLSATIIGAGGVPQIGDGLPRVCWKEGKGGVWAYVQGSYVSGNQYNFLFGGGATGDTIFYFLVAQDNVLPVPNVLASPSAGAGLYGHTPPSAGTPPTTPNSYRILSALTGILTVGTDPADDYSSLSGPGGLFNALNNSIITGPVHVQITSNLSETGTTALNALSYHVESFFDVFFELPPSGGRAAVLISGNYAGGLIRLNGADHISFDGGGAKEITIRNNSTSSSASVFSMSNGASWNTIRNCNIGAGSNTATTSGVYIATGAGNDHNTIEGNNIFKAYQGVYIDGSSTSDWTNNSVKNNIIGHETDSLKVTIYGIYATYQTNFEVSGNEVKNVINSTTTPPIGISVAYSNNMVISKNYIHDILYTGTSGYGAQGIYLYADEGVGIANPNILLSNNIVRHVSGDSDVPSANQNYIPTGIRIVGAATITQGIDVYYNSVYLTNDPLYGIGNNTFDVTGTWCAALSVEAGPTGINLSNNAFYNNLGEKAGYSYTSYGIAIWVKAVTSPFNTIDHNVYYSGSCDVNNVGMAGVNTTAPILTMDIAQWRTFTGQDVHSVFMNPNYQNNLLEFTGGSTYAVGGATPLIAVTEDYSGDLRDATFPTIGAHEFPWQATWTAAGTTTNWFTISNWNTPTIPGWNMSVSVPGVPAGGQFFPVITAGQTVNIKTMDLQNPATVKIETGGAMNVLKP